MQAIFTQAIGLVLAENQRVLHTINYPEVEQLAQKIVDAERIFVMGEGRSGLVIRMAAMRLMHLGCQVYVVGETTTPSIRSTDLLIACSGSGSTKTVCAIAAQAKAVGAYLVGVTVNKQSLLGQLVDLSIELAAATKQDLNNSASQQFAGSLFEQSTLLFFDALFYVLSQTLNKNTHLLLALHTNLE
ncbi:6-phospho-3-hexuloisomerase [Chroococcidiopsis sp. FACHB-1243]|uniref:6-phospho-3-hexuloisomerase n=1 Tax=Chroococcidiopsis sp. [FACHB-1243] TaxID=2692781 RepID=UPI00177FE774|nr:6-phospho-3-hexuloisomerase [Chroococcidiopsis sp. [FACHB-1243]]MBD2308709.1 6-phospho-3-hexuloisomerase [Chroococcidiopsis sp. [FACHB-1243]]